MKRLSILVAALALAGLAHAHGDSQVLTPVVSAISTSQTSAFAGTGGGMSISAATNHTTAGTTGAAIGSTLNGGNAVKGAAVEIGGTAASSSLSAAAQLSIGHASGAALGTGVGTSSIVGTGEAHTVSGGPQANVTGNAETISGSTAATGTNGLAISGGASLAGFNAGASASQIKVGPFNSVDTDTHAINTATTLPGVSFTMGTGTVQLQTEAAANAWAQAKVNK